MKKLLTAAALLATFTVGAANAAESQFDFSYSFASGDLLTGSLIGNLDATGTYIQNISNVQVVFDGVPFSNDVAINALDVTAWNTATTGWDDTATPVVSLNPLLNNFVFADTDVAQNLGKGNVHPTARRR